MVPYGVQVNRDQLLSPLGDDRFLRITAVEDLTGLARSTIYEHMAAGRFPRPFKAGRASRWRLSEIRTWMSDQPRADLNVTGDRQ
jgi:prophage regulatory protein